MMYQFYIIMLNEDKRGRRNFNLVINRKILTRGLSAETKIDV